MKNEVKISNIEFKVILPFDPTVTGRNDVHAVFKHLPYFEYQGNDTIHGHYIQFSVPRKEFSDEVIEVVEHSVRNLLKEFDTNIKSLPHLNKIVQSLFPYMCIEKSKDEKNLHIIESNPTGVDIVDRLARVLNLLDRPRSMSRMLHNLKVKEVKIFEFLDELGYLDDEIRAKHAKARK